MFKRLLTAVVTMTAIFLTSVYAVDFSTVLPWLYEQGFTKYTTVDEFRPLDSITRGEAAKFITQYAKISNLAKSVSDCSFTDISNYDSTLTPHIADACSYGLLKGFQGKFMPNNTITESQAITVIMRAIYGFQDETKEPWYQDYYDLGKQSGIIQLETIQSIDNTDISRAKLGERFYLAAQVNPQKTNFSPVYQPVDTTVTAPTDTSTTTPTNTTTKNTSTTTQTNQINDSSIKRTSGGGINLAGYKPSSADDSSDHIPGIYVAYDSTKVDTAIAEGKKIILFFHAPRCPSCKILHDAINAEADNIPPNMAIFRVDYDTSSSLKSTYSITKQHTLIEIDTSKKEIARSTSATTINDILELSGSYRI